MYCDAVGMSLYFNDALGNTIGIELRDLLAKKMYPLPVLIWSEMDSVNHMMQSL